MMEMRTFLLLSSVLTLLMCVVQGQHQERKVGRWTEWSGWSPCSETCGSGIATRTRYWEQPPGEKKFKRPYTRSENMICTNGSCPVDGTWSIWEHWSPCTEACGGGISERKRECNAPMHGGKDCDGDSFEEETCNRVPCPPLPPRFNMSACTAKHFMCTSKRMCIPMTEFCDDIVQCHDGSDEKRCYDVDNAGSVRYSYVRDTGSTYGASLSVITGLVVMVIMMRVIG